MLYKLCIIFISFLILQSCGSGSSSSSNTTTTVPEYQFELSAQLANECGQQVTFNQFEVHLQDENWQLIEKYSADVNGFVNFTTDQENINYTIIAKYQQGESGESLDVVSYHQANTTTTATYTATYDELLDNSTCECVTQDIELQHRAFTIIGSVSTSFNYENWYSIDSQNTYFTAAEVCRVINDEWPIQSISIRGADVLNNAIGAATLLEDFSSNTEGLWQAAAVEVADSVLLPSNHTGFEMKQSFANNEHFYVKTDEGDDEFLVFNTHPYISESKYHSVASHFFESLNTIFGLSTFTSHHQIKTSTYDEAFDVLAETQQPEIDNIGFSELAADGSYDYSTVSGYPLVEIAFDYPVSSLNSGASMPITWTMYGPISGTLASSVQLSGYEDIFDPNTYIQTTSIKIIKSSISNNYDDYIEYYQGNTDSAFADDLRYFQLLLAL